MRYFCAFALCVLLSGCSNMNLPISNPFSSTVSRETYLSLFPDIPIPADFHTVPKSTLVNTTQSNVKVGLETFEGNVSPAGAANLMLTGMPRQGWNLVGSVNGRRIMQLYQKEQRYAVLVFFDQTISTAMEVWVVSSGESTFSLPVSGGGSQAMPSIPAPSGTASSPTGGLSTQPLSQ